MNTLGLWLIWCSLPATVFALAGIAVHVMTRRSGPAVGALTSLTTLVVLAGVSLLTLSPWPHWWDLKVPGAASPLRVIVDDINASDSAPEGGAEMSHIAMTSGAAVEGVRPLPAAVADSWNSKLDASRSDRAQVASGASSWRWTGIVGVVFVMGLGLALIRLTLGLWMVHRYRAGSQEIIDPELGEQARQIASELGFTRPIELRQSRDLGSPATVGWRQPLVLLPANWTCWSAAERRVVLAHEIAHISRGDYPAWLLAQFSLVLHFYHPLAHWLVRRLRLEQELAADVLGAELAGGREFYLVTLTRMVLNQTAAPVAFAARPFLPTRGTFLKRIELLSENKSLPHGPWPRRRMAALVSAMSVLGLIVAGVRVQSSEPAPIERAGESHLAQATATTQTKAASDNKPVAESDLTVKPLTLDELRTIVIDQIRSLRSLHISYTKTEPASFGGKSQDHVWAEHGFKLLKRDVPNQTASGYGESFDGKRTYQLGHYKERPAGTDIRDEFHENFYLSVSSSLVGWLHTSGHRESIINAIRSPSAKLVAAKNGDRGPTIEVSDYRRSGANSYALHVTLVLDREHGYLPCSITYYDVGHPSWKFAHEVDQFVKVRDAATGTDRWFPARERYIQRTTENGEQVFTSVVNKVTINEPLPDDMFVLYSDLPPAAPNQEQQALADFEKAYLLAPGQLVKHIKRPYLPGRILNYKKWWADAFAQSPYETTGTFLPAVFPERDGKLGQPSFHFTGGTGENAVPASEVINSLDAILKLRYCEIDDPDKLLEKKVDGDYVIRADAPLDKLVPALGELLKSECNVPVSLEFRAVKYPVVAVSGKISPPFAIVPETVVELYTITPQAEGDNEQGTFHDFLLAVGKFIDPKLRLMNDVENSPYRQEKISWHRTVNKDGKTPLSETESRAVLDHLEQQTGLKFTLKSHEFPVIFVKRSE